MAGVDPAEALDDHPDVERDHERDERLERDLEPELAMRLGERLGQNGAPLAVYSGEPLAQVLRRSRRAPGSSSQTFS